MSWLFLLAAGLLEVVWAVGLKYANGLSRPYVFLVCAVAMVISVALLGIAMRNIPLGVAYAVWTGIGIVGTFIAGLVLAESISAMQCVSILLILVGLVGLKLSN
jgi:quaternary ammonium compound-resistance protein SugE